MRHDTVDQFGKLTLRHASRLRHLGAGRAHADTKVHILVTATTVTVIAQPDHKVIATHHIDPNRSYWRNQNKSPGRWPGQAVTDDTTHVTHDATHHNGAPEGIRTPNLLIRSQMLYPLSYGRMSSVAWPTCQPRRRREDLNLRSPLRGTTH